MKYSEEQICALKVFYPVSDYSSLAEYFPGLSKRQIMQFAHNHGIKNNNPGHLIDLTGQVFGRLTVLEIDHKSTDSRVYWKCRCICGNECVVIGTSLKRGYTKSCGCLNNESISKRSIVDHTGEKYGLLTLVERLPHYLGKNRTY